MVLKMAHFRKSTGPRWVKVGDSFQSCGGLAIPTGISNRIVARSLNAIVKNVSDLGDIILHQKNDFHLVSTVLPEEIWVHFVTS